MQARVRLSAENVCVDQSTVRVSEPVSRRFSSDPWIARQSGRGSGSAVCTTAKSSSGKEITEKADLSGFGTHCRESSRKSHPGHGSVGDALLQPEPWALRKWSFDFGLRPHEQELARVEVERPLVLLQKDVGDQGVYEQITEVMGLRVEFREVGKAPVLF